MQDKEAKKALSAKNWRAIAVTALCLLAAVAVLYALGVGWKQEPAKQAPAATQAAQNRSRKKRNPPPPRCCPIGPPNPARGRS